MFPLEYYTWEKGTTRIAETKKTSAGLWFSLDVCDGLNLGKGCQQKYNCLSSRTFVVYYGSE